MKMVEQHEFVAHPRPAMLMDMFGRWKKNPNKVDVCEAVLSDGSTCRAIREVPFHTNAVIR